MICTLRIRALFNVPDARVLSIALDLLDDAATSTNGKLLGMRLRFYDEVDVFLGVSRLQPRL